MNKIHFRKELSLCQINRELRVALFYCIQPNIGIFARLISQKILNFLQFYKVMNFQTNKLQSVNSVDQYYVSALEPIRFKTCHSDTIESQNVYKRFQRSQDKKFGSNQSLGQNRQRQRILTCLQTKKNIDNFGACSSIRQINLVESQISTQKFIPYSIKESKVQGKCQKGQNQHQSSIKQKQLQTSKLIKTQPKLIVSNKQLFPTKNNNENFAAESKIEVMLPQSQLILKKQQNDQRQAPKTTTNAKAFEKFKVLFSKTKPETPAQRTNTSTECSINERKLEKKGFKCTSGCQTDAKKQINSGMNTVPVKSCSLKIQTQIDWNYIEKNLTDLKSKLANMEQENKKLKIELFSCKRQKQNFSKSLIESKDNMIKTQRSMTSYQKHYQNSTKSGIQSEGQTLREKSLQQMVSELKKEVQSLKQGLGLKKTQEMLESMKRENIALINQIQTISLRCRVLQQHNNQLGSSQNENRKLKMEIKYFRGSIKDHQTQIDRLKVENRKLRTQFKVKANHCENSRVLSAWGSETDSLNLSVSFIRE